MPKGDLHGGRHAATSRKFASKESAEQRKLEASLKRGKRPSKGNLGDNYSWSRIGVLDAKSRKSRRQANTAGMSDLRERKRKGK